MRKVIASALVAALAVMGAPLAAAASQQGGTLKGVTQGADKKPLPNYTVQVRSKATGKLAGTTTSTGAGSFSFDGLPAGDYVIEILDSTGKVVGLSSPITVAAGAAVSVTVNATAAGTLVGASHGGVGVFGLGKVATIGLISAAGVATVAGVIVAKKDASPSR